jgi:hypothetical protein
MLGENFINIEIAIDRCLAVIPGEALRYILEMGRVCPRVGLD